MGQIFSKIAKLRGKIVKSTTAFNCDPKIVKSDNSDGGYENDRNFVWRYLYTLTKKTKKKQIKTVGVNKIIINF